MAHEFNCEMCAFSVRAEDDDELIRTVRRHGRDQHDIQLSRDDVRNGWEDARAEADD